MKTTDAEHAEILRLGAMNRAEAPSVFRISIMRAVEVLRATEGKRIDRWHATYNAALTGVLSRGESQDHAVKHALDHADAAHGPREVQP